MSKERNGERSGRTRHFHLHDAPRHIFRAIGSRDPEMFAASKPVIDQDAQRMTMPTHMHLRTSNRHTSLASIEGSREGMAMIERSACIVH
ncbi:MAG TPA: hypothetical protein VF573_26465 [Paraburkholderia sp.]|uniref:hypothetical protein n=1 Tax=Paraburkholderia sp. TaxID=1926495 RepID=UPI002ED2CB77